MGMISRELPTFQKPSCRNVQLLLRLFPWTWKNALFMLSTLQLGRSLPLVVEYAETPILSRGCESQLSYSSAVFCDLNFIIVYCNNMKGGGAFQMLCYVRIFNCVKNPKYQATCFRRKK